MLKLGKKGFMLAETLVVSTVLLITFTFLYSQFFDVFGKFSVYSDYDNVDKLYTVSDIKTFIKNDNISAVVNQLDTNLALGTPQPYVDITDCSIFTETDFCTELFDQLNVDRILFSPYNLNDSFGNFIGITHDLDRRMQTYVGLLSSDLSSDYDSEYRLIIRFDDGTYSTGRISEFEQVASAYQWSNWLSMGNTSSVNYASQIYFDGIDDYVSIADSTDLNTATTYDKKTIEVSFETGGDVTTTQVIYEQGGQTNGMNIYVDSGKLYTGIWSTGQSMTPIFQDTTIVANTKYFVSFVFSYSGGFLKTYIDGVETDSSVPDALLNSHGANIGFGAANGDTNFHSGGYSGTGNFFNGKIFKLRLFNEVARTATEILENYNQTLTGDETGLVVLYDLTDVNGSTLIDLSGNDNDGNIIDISTDSVMYPAETIGDGYIGQDGVDDYIEIPTIGYDSYTNMTISTDFKMNSYINPGVKVYNSIFSWYRSNSGSGNAAIVHVYIDTSGGLTLRIGNGSTGSSELVSGLTMELDRKYNITVTIASGTASLYVDGVLKKTSTVASFPAIVAYPMHLGIWEVYEDYGDMDFYNLNIYNRVLSTDEMAAIIETPPTENELGLVASYSFDEGAGTTATDYIGSNTGTIIDGIWGYDYVPNLDRLIGVSNPMIEQLAGKDDGYITFDGTNDIVEVAHSESLNVSNTDEITIAAWIYPTGTASVGTIASKPAEYFFDLDTTGKLACYTFYDNGGSSGTSSYSYSNSKIPLNTWTHVAFSENSTGIRKFYINGILDASSQAEASIWSEDTYSLFLGGIVTPARYFKGNIRSINIFNEALTQAEVQNYMFNMPLDTMSSLIGSYDMEEGTGTDVADGSMYSNDGVKADGTWGTEYILGEEIVSQSNSVYEVQTKVASYRYNDYSLHFDGVDDYIIIPTLPSSIDFASGFDVEFTATWDQTLSSGRIMDFGNGAPQDNILIYTIGTSTTERFSVYGSVYGYMEMPIPVVLDEYAKFKYTVRSGGDFEMYKDGIFLGSTANAGVISNVDRTLNYLGKSNWVADAYFSGSIYEFKVTEADGDIVLWYTMDEGSGNTLYDKSGNGYDGIIMGASWDAAGTSSLWNIDGMPNQLYNNFLKKKHLYVDSNFLYRYRMIEQ